MKRCAACLLIVSILCVFSLATAEETPWEQALADGKTPVLLPAALPDAAPEGGALLSLSPDGKAALWKTGSSLCLTRDGKLLPVVVAPERGVGDPYQKLEKDLVMIARYLPGQEGVAWSPDGRYAALTCKDQVAKANRPLDLMVLDAQTGEVFLTVACDAKFLAENGGVVYEAKFDGTGRYLYFTARLRAFSKTDALYRCDLATFQTELVCEGMTALLAPGLFEKADGSWLVLGAPDTHTAKSPEILEILSPASPQSRQRFARFMPAAMWQTEYMRYSSASGYGLMIGHSLTSASNGYDGNAPALYARILLNAICLSRITPEKTDMDQYWLFRADAEDLSDLKIEALDADTLSMVRQIVNEGSVTAGDDAKLKEYADALVRHPAQIATCACLSPDGRWALIHIGRSSLFRFFLMDLETMALYPVDAPEGLAGPAIGTALGRAYPPGMVWNDDGTLLIYTAASQSAEAYRLTAR